MTDGFSRRPFAEGGRTRATVFGVCAVLLLAAAVQAGESKEAVAEFGAERAADPPGVTAADDGGGHCVASDTALCLLKENREGVGRYEVSIALGAPEHFDAVAAGSAPGPEDWETCDVPPGRREPMFPCHTKVVKGGARVIGTDDSGLFYFFGRNNWEVLIKVLDGCKTALPNHWVYAASASDQGMQITVRDTAWTEDAREAGRVPMRVYNFPPHKRRPQAPGESDDDYQRNVLAKGHPALTAATETDAFPNVCPAPAAANEVADAGGEVDPEDGSPGSS